MCLALLLQFALTVGVAERAGAATAWLDSHWQFRVPVTVSNASGAAALTGYDVQVTLPASFDFAKTQPLGGDLRFTAADGVTVLSSWTEQFNAATKTGVVWVRVPTIPAHSSTSLYLYYGNPSASSVSSGPSTFPFFGDFSNPAWTSLPAMPYDTADESVAVVNGKIYIIGGYDNTASDPLATTYQFDPASSTYTQLAPMPKPRWGLITVAVNGKIYAMGGAGGGGGTTAVYDPATNIWSTLQKLPSSIANQGLTGCTDGTMVYLFYNGLSYSYDPATDTYVQLASMPNFVRSWASCGYVNGKVYVVGGYVSPRATTFTQIYSPATNTWTTGAPMPFGTYGSVREDPVVGANLYIVSGQRANDEFSSKAYVYNTTSNVWREKSFGPHAADGVAGGVVNGKLYIFGGRQDATGPYGLNYATVYDPAADTGSPWTQVTGGYEVSGNVLREMIPSRGTLPSLVSQIRPVSYATSGDFVLEAQTQQGATAGWSSAVVDGNSGVYQSTLKGYLALDDNFATSPTTDAIYKENGSAVTKLASRSPAVTGSQRFKVSSTSTQVAVARNNAAFLTTSDRQYRNGSIGLLSSTGDGTTWNFLFTRPYSSVEPTISLGAEQVGPTPPPVTAVLVPSAGAALSGASLLDASASSRVGISTVEFHATGGVLNDAVLGTATSTQYGWMYLWNTAAVADGTYSLQSVAYDSTGQSTRSTAVSVSVDNTPPTTTMLLPSDGAVLSGTGTLDASASDSRGIAKVEFHATGGSLDDTLLGTATPTKYGWIDLWDTTTVPDGTYSVQSVAYDKTGNVGRSTPVSVTVDNTPPTTVMVAPSDGATLSGLTTLDATASDKVAVTNVEFRLTGGDLNDATIATGTLGSTDWTASWDTTTVPDGTYTLQSVALDEAGNVGRSTPVSVTILNSP